MELNRIILSVECRSVALCHSGKLSCRAFIKDCFEISRNRQCPRPELFLSQKCFFLFDLGEARQLVRNHLTYAVSRMYQNKCRCRLHKFLVHGNEYRRFSLISCTLVVLVLSVFHRMHRLGTFSTNIICLKVYRFFVDF